MQQIYSMVLQKKKEIAIILCVILMLHIFPSNILGNMEAKAADSGYGLNNPVTESNGVVTWDCVWFGNYWQEDTNGDGIADKNDAKQPIKWRVLSVDGDDAFLLADKNLDCQWYNKTSTNVTWETCTMRSWLNGDFHNNAFAAREQSAIKITNVVNDDTPYYGTEGGNDTSDKVYLLSLDEVMNSKYGFLNHYVENDEAKRTKNTWYAEDQGAWTALSEEYDGNALWWLRSPGLSNGNAAFVDYDGSVDYDGYDVGDNGISNNKNIVGVRPALHLNLSSVSSWSYAGTVISKGGDAETGTPPVASPESGTEAPPVAPPEPGVKTPKPAVNFQLGRDNNSFAHCSPAPSAKDKNQYYCDKNGAYITEGRYLRTLSSGIGEYLALLYASGEEWEGSCYGISLGMLLNKADKVDLDSFGVKSFYDIKPYTNVAARKYLNFLYLSQSSSKYNTGKMTAAYTRKDGTGNCTKKDFFEQFLNAVKIGENNGIPVAFLYAKSKGGHAVLATSVKDEGDRYLVTMYDMNTVSSSLPDPKGQTLIMTVGKDFSDFIFKDGNGVDVARDYIELRFLDTDALLAAPFENTSRSLRNLEKDTFEKMDDETTVVLNDNTKLVNSNGNTLNYVNGEISGDMKIYNDSPVYRSMQDGEAGTLDYLVQVPTSEAYSIEAQKDRVDVTLYDESKFVAVNGNDVESITTGATETKVEGSNANYSIALPANNDNCSLYQFDMTSNDAVYHYEGNSLSVTSEEGMSNIVVSACRDMDYTGKGSVSITANKIEIVPDQDEMDKINILASDDKGNSEIASLTIGQVSEEEPESTLSPVPTSAPASGNKPTAKPVISPKPVKKTTTNFSYRKTTSNNTKKSMKKPGKVTGVNLSVKKGGKIDISWNNLYSNTTGYQIQYARNKRFSKKKKTKNVSGYLTWHKTIGGLKKGKIYYVRVRAYNKKSGRKLYGKWSKAKKIKILK